MPYFITENFTNFLRVSSKVISFIKVKALYPIGIDTNAKRFRPMSFKSTSFPAQHHLCYHLTHHFQLNDFSSTTSPLLSSDPGSDGKPQYKAKEATADEAKKSSGSKAGTVNVLRVFLRAFGLSFAIRQVCNRTNKRSKRRSCQNEMCVFMSVRDMNI